MKKLLIIVYSAFVIIVLTNYFYYRSLYDKQINYIFELLDRQVQIVGLSVDETNNGFLSDLNQINFTEDFNLFFSNPDNQRLATDKMKLFFSKYRDFVTGIKFYDNKKNEFTLKQDIENRNGEWLEQSFILHVQGKMYQTEKLIQENRKFNYYLPVLDHKTNEIIGNFVVTVDFQKFFREIFNLFNLEDYQWQWVISDSGQIVYNNFDGNIEYSQLGKITGDLAEGSVKNLSHSAVINGKRMRIISSYYSTQLLQESFGLIFSAPTDFFQKYIIRNSLLIVICTLLLIQAIIFIFWKYMKSLKSEMGLLKTSENTLFKLIAEMPVGVIIYDKFRKILKANKVASDLYSYQDESEMMGKLLPETSFPESNEYLSPDPDETLSPGQFIKIKKENREIDLYSKSIPVNFSGSEATMEILIDITMLESARKQEAKANIAKSEFLARMSYEIRTPLDGIIGMTDVLNKYELKPEVKGMVRLLRQSTEVLLNVINNILDFSRIESGKMILDEVPFILREETNYCTELARTNISNGSLKIISTFDENVPERIIGDPYRFKQVLTNLLNHSVRNTKKGEIRLRCMLMNKENCTINIGFELSDTGLSYDKPALEKIFGNFANIESKTAINNDESFFGTIISRQLVEMMGGTLKAESPSGLSGDTGTKVTFTITACADHRTVKNIKPEEITTFDRIKALAIWGNHTRDEETLGIFHRTGIKVKITTFTKLTVNQIRASLDYPDERYNLIIIFDDADFDGFEAARLIWENKLSQNFYLLLITSHDRKGNYNRCMTLGIDQYLIKPFEPNEMVSMIKDFFPFVQEPLPSLKPESIRTDIRILIVEDNKMNQKVIGAMLQTLGYSFDIAEDGYTGFLQAKAKKYDLIFMDLLMPELDGFEASQRIVKFDKSVIIVAFSADNMPETRKKAELSGITEFLSKPVRIDELKKLFSRHFKE